MSRVDYGRGAAVEGLESRLLFVATPGPNFVAMLARAQAIAADQVSLSQHEQTCEAAITASRAALAETIASGRSLIASDKAAVVANRGDAALLAQAKQKLATDKAQVRADTATAKAQLKQDLAECRTEGRQHTAALKQELAGLKTDLKSASPATRAAVKKLVADWESIQAGSELTNADLQGFADSLRAAADGATQPSAESFEALQEHFVSALLDGAISAEEEAVLTTDFTNLFSSADIPPDESQAIVDDALVVLSKLGATDAELATLALDLQAVYASFDAA